MPRRRAERRAGPTPLRARPRASRTTSPPGLGEPLFEERLHLAGMALAQTPWPEPQQHPVDAAGSFGHHASYQLPPAVLWSVCRARDRATLTMPPAVRSRPPTPRPARVMR